MEHTYLTCYGHFLSSKNQFLRWIVDFKNPDVKNQLREAIMEGRYSGNINVNGKIFKWNLNNFEMQNNTIPDKSTPITFDMLTAKGKEIVLKYLVSDFWFAGFSIKDIGILNEKYVSISN